MHFPSRAFFEHIVGAPVAEFEINTIHVGAMCSQVYRVVLHAVQGHPAPASLIVKVIQPDWPDDPYGQDREWRFYRKVLPRLDIPHPKVYHLGMDPETKERMVVMEDLAGSYSFPPPTHGWTDAEACSLLRAYARLHVQGRACLPPEADRAWLLPRYSDRLPDGRIPDQAAELAQWGIWEPLPRLGRLYEQTLWDMAEMAAYPDTLLHNDSWPPNVALPQDLDQEAIIIDWGMLSWGWAELDLAYFFLQPYGASKKVDRGRALACYWAQRRDLEGDSLAMDDLTRAQRHADRVLALVLVGVAHARAQQPLPKGSPGWAYWDAMFGVLNERLAALCAEI